VTPLLYDGELVYMCREKWPAHTARQFFTVTSLILQYVVPVSLITYCYTRVSVALHRRARARASITGRTSAGDREQVGHFQRIVNLTKDNSYRTR